jgi:DNA-binding winged helix-turn-helix (wHTH) protein
MNPVERVGDVVFDPRTGEIRKQDAIVRLEPQPAAVLALLVGRRGELVSHDELRRAVWGETTHVNFQQSLHYCIRQIRMALDDKVRPSPLIETIPRRGYRLRASESGLPVNSTNTAVGRVPRGKWRLWTAAAAAILLVAGVTIERRPNNHHEMAVALLQAVHDFVY